MPWILFVLSSIVLTLEVLETKIFAYSLENSLIFLVVGVVLLGFGTGGTVLSLKREIGDPKLLVRRSLLATAILLVLAHVWFALHSDELAFRFDGWTISLLTLLAAPYFTAGLAISAILAEPHGNVHARYGVNLIGSAVGCSTVFFALGPLTGPELLIVCAGVIALLAVPLTPGRAKLPLAAGILVVTAPLFAFADEILPYQVQRASSGGQLALIEEHTAETIAREDSLRSGRLVEDFDRWDPTARVQVHSIEVDTDNAAYAQLAETSRWFTQDSSYGSPLVGRGEHEELVRGVYDRTLYGAGYFRGKEDQDVLIIGLGGAPDVQTALHHDVASIQGVDINASTVDMVRGPMADYLGDPYGDPRVTLHLRDGRSYVRSSDQRYDLIQLSGVDTKSVLASGTLALNESYLYTQEALDEYLAHLTDDGILCVMYAGTEFAHRLLATAIRSLERLGAETPTQHLIVLDQSQIFAMLVKRTPFTDAECDRMLEWLAAADAGDGAEDGLTGVVVLVYELLTPSLSLMPAPTARFVPGRINNDAMLTAAVAGELDPWLDTQEANLRPAPDWKPFFFNTVRNERVWSEMPGHFARLFRMLAIMSALAVVLILVPLLVLRSRGIPALQNAPFAVYFAALGAGYIMAMSGMIQRYVLFLGHQSYAFGLVIGGLLVAAGVGSILAGRFQERPKRVMLGAATAICVMLLLIQLGLDTLFDATAGLELGPRIGIALLVLFPLGVPLGMMFPTGLGLVKRSSPLFVPWAFGINGVFSVIGTTLVLPGSMLYGFPAMAGAAGGVYVLAALVGTWCLRRM